MSNSSWKKLLLESLSQAARKPDSRIAFIGVGSELHGDDAAGIEVIRRLSRRFPNHEIFTFIEGGTLPESVTGPIRRFAPQAVIILDAADFGGQPGEICWLTPNEIRGFSGSTHTFPLGKIAEYFNQEFRCEVRLLGIQPDTIDFGAGLSRIVRKAIMNITRTITLFINQSEKEQPETI